VQRVCLAHMLSIVGVVGRWEFGKTNCETMARHSLVVYKRLDL